MTDFLTRFAPSPTGRLHLGHAASAFHVWQAAERAGGRVLLRIEDIDTTRCKREYTDGIIEDLAWLGLDWPQPVRIQSEHFADYGKTVQNLAVRGMAYRCFRTRAELAGLPQPFVGAALPEDEEAARLERGEAFAWRLSLEAAKAELGPVWGELDYQTLQDGASTRLKAQPECHGDVVIARKDSPSAYHLAATYDDALQGITHVIRGEDLIDAPHIQVVLQALMGWPAVIYHHHPLIMGPDGKRLSKTHKSQSLASLRESGMTPDDIRKAVGF